MCQCMKMPHWNHGKNFLVHDEKKVLQGEQKKGTHEHNVVQGAKQWCRGFKYPYITIHKMCPNFAFKNWNEQKRGGDFHFIQIPWILFGITMPSMKQRLWSHMGIRLVWRHWNGLTSTLQTVHQKSDWPMWSPSYSTNGPPHDWVHAVVGQASSPCLSACGGRTDAHVDCPPNHWVHVVAGPRPPTGWVLVVAGQGIWNHRTIPVVSDWFHSHKVPSLQLGRWNCG